MKNLLLVAGVLLAVVVWESKSNVQSVRSVSQASIDQEYPHGVPENFYEQLGDDAPDQE